MKNNTLIWGLTALVTLAITACQPPDPPLTNAPHAPAAKAVPPAAPAPTPEVQAPPPVAVTPTPQPKVVPPPPKPEVKVLSSAKGYAAVAWEDRSPPNDDNDFNDAVIGIIPREIVVNNNITDIIIDFYPRAVGAEFDHSVLMILNGIKEDVTTITNPITGVVTKTKTNIVHTTDPLFNGRAEVNLTLYDVSNYTAADHDKKQFPPVLSSKEVPIDKDVVIFPSTHWTFGSAPRMHDGRPIWEVINTQPPPEKYLPARQAARLTIHLLDSQLNPFKLVNNELDLSRFRIMLHVINTKQDIDIVDVDPTSVEEFPAHPDPAHPCKKELGCDPEKPHPHGFIIPSDWRWPLEGVLIDKAYSSFEGYRVYLNAHIASADIKGNHVTVKPFTFATDSFTWYSKTPPNPKLVYRPVADPVFLPDPTPAP